MGPVNLKAETFDRFQAQVLERLSALTGRVRELEERAPSRQVENLRIDVGSLKKINRRLWDHIQELKVNSAEQGEAIEKRLAQPKGDERTSRRVSELGSRVTKLEKDWKALNVEESLEKLADRSLDLAEAHKALGIRVDLVTDSVEQLEA